MKLLQKSYDTNHLTFIGMLLNYLGKWMAGTAERICAKFIQKTCLVLRSDDFECQEVKVTEDRKALCTHNTPAV